MQGRHAHRVTHLAHDGGRFDAPSGNVADADHDRSVVEFDGVVPVAAELTSAGGRRVHGVEVEFRRLRN